MPAASPRKTDAAPPAGPEGIYLTDGGLRYFLIDRGEDGALRGEGILLGGDVFRVSRRGANLLIESRIVNPMFDAPAGDRLWGGYFELAPSAAIPGDWDLRRFRHPSTLLGAEAAATVFNPRKILTEDDLPEPEPWDVPSFLHRLDDVRLAGYFLTVKKYRDAPEIHDDAAALLAAHPADPWVRMLYLDACVRTGRLEDFAARLAAWRPDFDAIAQPELRANLQQADRVLLAHLRSAEGRNAWDYITARLLSPEADLAARTAALGGLAAFEFCEPPFQALNQEEQMGYIEGQVTAKTLVMQATLRMLEGRFDEARATLTGVYQWGWLLEQSGPIISQLIGISIRSIAIHGFETLALNAPDEHNAAANWAAISTLPSFMAGGKTMDDRYIKLRQLMPGFGANTTEAEVRGAVIEARLANLKTLAAARLIQARTGALPAAGEDMAHHLPGAALPGDPFADGVTQPPSPLRISHESGAGVLTVYSLGPDRNDDAGAISYDPTNGTVSDGDVLLRVQPERAIPFPAAGVRAASGADVARQFPAGLPRDVFADTRSPLRVTDGAPVRVWSWGPDCNESDAEQTAIDPSAYGLPGSIGIETEQGFQTLPGLSVAPGSNTSPQPYIPAIPYDPTNGIVSDGDIFIELPAP